MRATSPAWFKVKEVFTMNVLNSIKQYLTNKTVVHLSMLALVDEHAKAHNQARSASLNEILAQALTPHT